jgi:hypothetical protein
MNKLIGSKMDKKNIELSKNLYWLRHELDVYCLIGANGNNITKMGIGKNFFLFLQKSCVDLITLNICKIYENEKTNDLNSIEGVLKHIEHEKTSGLESSHVEAFIQKHGHRLHKGELLTDALSLTVAAFKSQYHEQLDRFRTCRDKKIAHSEYGVNIDSLPSFHDMEQLFNFGLDFYMLVSRAFISVGPCDLNNDRRVKASFKKILQKLGLEEIKMEME